MYIQIEVLISRIEKIWVEKPTKNKSLDKLSEVIKIPNTTNYFYGRFVLFDQLFDP